MHSADLAKIPVHSVCFYIRHISPDLPPPLPNMHGINQFLATASLVARIRVTAAHWSVLHHLRIISNFAHIFPPFPPKAFAITGDSKWKIQMVTDGRAVHSMYIQMHVVIA
jgi:hypothetical protein